jgi:hypothetical protein
MAEHFQAIAGASRPYWADPYSVESCVMRKPTKAQKIARARRQKNRAMPPPFPLDIDALPDSAILSAKEIAAIIRRTVGALEQWRRNPDHPLKWERVDGRPLYRVGWLRSYLARPERRASS